MGIRIEDFKLSNERQIRELIPTPQGVVEVYEPTLENLQMIIDLQQMSEEGVVSFDGFTVVKHLFPALTNIELDGLSDEEIHEIVNNPKIHFRIACEVVAQIVAEANKLYAHRAKSEIMNAESQMASIDLLNSIPTFIVEQARENGTLTKLTENVEKLTDELAEKMKEEIQKEAETEEVEDGNQNAE